MAPEPAGPVSEREVRRGEVYWIPPEALSGPPSACVHPHVVVQDDVFNRSRIPTVVVCGLTSNLRRAGEPGNVVLEAGEGGLERRSVVLVSQIDTAPKQALGARIGQLSSRRVDQILAGLRFQQASFHRR